MGSGEGGEEGTAGEFSGDGSGGHGWFLGWGGIYKVEDVPFWIGTLQMPSFLISAE